MKEVTPVILLRSLNIIRGGVTKASIKRANFLADKYKEVIICTFKYQQHYHEILEELYSKKILRKNVKVLNFFEEIKPCKSRMKKFTDKKAQKVKEKDLIEIKVSSEKGSTYRYYRDGFYVKFKKFNECGGLILIDHFNDNRQRIKRTEYDEKGFVTRVRHMDITTNKPILDRYLDYKGFCYLSVRVNSKTNTQGLSAQFTGVAHEYKTLKKCQQNWFNYVMKKTKRPIVTSELRELDSFLINTPYEKVKKIAVFHSNHLKSPFNDITKMTKGYKRVINNAGMLDKIILLTEEQEKDIKRISNEHDKFKVISHSYKQIYNFKNKELNNEYNPKLAVTLARFHEVKNLESAIKAFKYVVERIPEAEYHIYGHGKLKKDLQNLINNLNLEKNVFLKEYTLDPATVYKSAACSVLTSKQEGFAMVLVESMAAGTPVVSYNIKYGPNDIINNGVNGFLVPEGNEKELSKKIIEIMENRHLRATLSKNALIVRKKYNEDKYKQQWLNVFQ